MYWLERDPPRWRGAARLIFAFVILITTGLAVAGDSSKRPDRLVHSYCESELDAVRDCSRSHEIGLGFYFTSKYAWSSPSLCSLSATRSARRPVGLGRTWRSYGLR